MEKVDLKVVPVKEARSFRGVQLHLGIRFKVSTSRGTEDERIVTFADGYSVAEGVGERQPRCTQLTSSPLGVTIIITVTSGTVGDIVVILVVYAERGLDRLAMAAKVYRQGGGSSAKARQVRTTIHY